MGIPCSYSGTVSELFLAGVRSQTVGSIPKPGTDFENVVWVQSSSNKCLGEKIRHHAEVSEFTIIWLAQDAEKAIGPNPLFEFEMLSMVRCSTSRCTHDQIARLQVMQKQLSLIVLMKFRRLCCYKMTCRTS